MGPLGAPQLGQTRMRIQRKEPFHISGIGSMRMTILRSYAIYTTIEIARKVDALSPPSQTKQTFYGNVLMQPKGVF